MTPYNLAVVFIVLIPLSIPRLPYGGQIADLALLGLSATLLRRPPALRMRLPDFFLFSYLAASGLSWVVSPTVGGGFAFAKQCFVSLAYWTFAALSARGDSGRISRWIAGVGAAMAALAIFAAGSFGLIGADAVRLGQPMSLPYLGTVYRSTVFFETPEMLLEFLAVSLPFALGLAVYSDPKESRFWRWASVMITIAMLLTFARGLPGAAAGALFFLWPELASGWKRGVRIVAAIGIGAAILAVNLALTFAVRKVEVTHGYDVTTSAPSFPYGFQELGTGAPNITLKATYNPMSYLLLKRTAIATFMDSPVLGIGLGRFPEATQRAYLAGQLHELYRSAKPHSTLLGRLAETGILGGLTLIGFWAAILHFGIMASRRPTSNAWVARAASAGAVALLVNSPNVDVMNFRFLWLILGLLRGSPI